MSYEAHRLSPFDTARLQRDPDIFQHLAGLPGRQVVYVETGEATTHEIDPETLWARRSPWRKTIEGEIVSWQLETPGGLFFDVGPERVRADLCRLIPQRRQLSRKKGHSLPPWAVSVARPTRWGNPFRVESTGYTVEEVVAEFRRCLIDMFEENPEGWRDYYDLDRLAGRDLACWCPLDQPCHADVWLEVANTPGWPNP